MSLASLHLRRQGSSHSNADPGLSSLAVAQLACVWWDTGTDQLTKKTHFLNYLLPMEQVSPCLYSSYGECKGKTRAGRLSNVVLLFEIHLSQDLSPAAMFLHMCIVEEQLADLNFLLNLYLYLS